MWCKRNSGQTTMFIMHTCWGRSSSLFVGSRRTEIGLDRWRGGGRDGNAWDGNA